MTETKGTTAKPVIQYHRNGKPITNPSVNSLSGVAYFYTKGIDELPRVSTTRLEAILADLGVANPRTEAFKVTLPNGTELSATVGKLAPVPAKGAKAAPTLGERLEAKQAESDAKVTRASAKLSRIAALKAEGQAIKAWEEGGERGRRPATPVTDEVEAEQRAKRAREAAKAEQTAHKPTVAPAKRSGKATTPKSRQRASSDVAKDVAKAQAEAPASEPAEQMAAVG